MKKCRSCPSLVVELHEVINVNLSFVQTFFSIIGSVRENEIGYGLTANNNSFSSLLILLLSFASIRRKLLKTTYTEEQSIHTNSESFKNSYFLISVKMFTKSNFLMTSLSKVVIAIFRSICFSDHNSLTHWKNMPQILI